MNQNTTPSQFEQDLEPLICSIEIVYELEIIPFIMTERSMFKETFLISIASRTAYNDFIKKSMIRCRELVSSKYIDKLKILYFTDEGLNLYIIKTLNSVCNDYISGKD